MSVYSRFKRDPEGFRKLVELLETTPMLRRQKMIEVGMTEDAVYTEKVLKYVMTFEDVINLPDVELAELLAVAPPRIAGYAVSKANEEVRTRFLRNCRQRGEMRDYIEAPNVGLREVGGAQLKIVEIARTLERKGLIRIKQIPMNGFLNMLKLDKEKYLQIARTSSPQEALTQLYRDTETWEHDTFEGDKGYVPQQWEALREVRAFARELWDISALK